MLHVGFEPLLDELLPGDEEVANLAIAWARLKGHKLDRKVHVVPEELCRGFPQGFRLVHFMTGTSLGGGRSYLVNVATGEVRYCGQGE